VAEIRLSQSSIQNALSEIVGHLRGGATFTRSTPTYQQPYHNRSPSMQSMGSPPLSVPPPAPGMDMSHNMQTPGVHSVNNFSPGRPPLTPVVTGPPSQQHRGSISHSNMMSPTQVSASTSQYHPPQLPPSYNNFTSSTPMYNSGGNSQGPVLPPFSSLQSGSAHQGNMSSIRYNSHGDSTLSSASGSKRTAPPSSNVTSANSSDNEEDDNGGLPASGLVAPWEVLRNLANVAIQREAKVYW
jgi:hypothetical protein